MLTLSELCISLETPFFSRMNSAENGVKITIRNEITPEASIAIVSG